MRRRLLESLKAFEATGTPLGVGGGVDYTATRSVQAVIPKEMPWQELADSVRAAGGEAR
jgi:tripartite-type tricarboxylate transporter receptor subunit TctC